MKQFGNCYAIIAVVLFSLVLMLPAFLDRPRYQTYVATMQWEPNTPFIADGQPARDDFPSSVLQATGVGFWRNYSPQRGVFPGQVCSSFFVLRSRQLIVPVVGFPNSEDAGIYVESETGHQRFPILYGATHTQWQPFTLNLPKALINTPVRIVAYSQNARAYIGVGTPYYRTNYAFPGLPVSKLFVAILLSVFYPLVLFFPAFSWLRRFRSFEAVERVLASLVLTSLLSLPLFFLAFYFPPIARVVVYLWLLLSTVLIIRMALVASRGNWSRSASRCLVILAALTVFQALFLFSFDMHRLSNSLTRVEQFGDQLIEGVAAYPSTLISGFLTHGVVTANRFAVTDQPASSTIAVPLFRGMETAEIDRAPPAFSRAGPYNQDDGSHSVELVSVASAFPLPGQCDRVPAREDENHVVR